MTGLERFNSPAKVQRIGNDSIYGTGSDGNTIVVSNVSLTRDMYFNNLTINSGSHLNTNGFKLFVKNTLTVNGSVGISAGVAVSNATLVGTSNIAENTFNSIGGSAAGVTYVASQASASVLAYVENILNGGVVDTFGTFSAFTGGAGGENGAAGTVTPATAGSGATAGGAGGAGSLNRNTLAPGGPGSAGTPGSNGVAGSTPPAASAGAGARGGGVVAVIAKSISGTGSIISLGSHATTGGASATGSGATNGAAGSAGSAAPAQALAHYTQSHGHYITGDGTHGTHASTPTPVLPSAHVPAAAAYHAHGYWINTHHAASCIYPANHHGGSSPHTNGWIPNHVAHQPVAATSGYYLQGGIDHAAGGHLGHDGAVAHTFVHTSASQSHNNYTETDACPDTAGHYKGEVIHHTNDPSPRNRQDNWGYHDNGNYRNAGASRSVGHVSKAGGAAGAAGLAGTNGTNGSTTAGTNGKSGGGGGIFIISDSTPTGVTTSASGGTIGGVAGSSGNIITILNA